MFVVSWIGEILIDDMSSAKLRNDASNPSAQNANCGEICLGAFIKNSLMSKSSGCIDVMASGSFGNFSTLLPFAGVDRSDDGREGPHRLDVSDIDPSELSSRYTEEGGGVLLTLRLAIPIMRTVAAGCDCS